MRFRRRPQPRLAGRFRAALRNLTLVAGASAVTLMVPSGCSRPHYRQRTDNEAYYLLDQKRAQSCEIDPATIRIELDPRSRMFDPFNPDRPPMPEDDPQANRFMQRVDNKKGYPLWEANGRTNIVENPQWWDYLPLDERGVLVLNMEDAVRIALLHSPDYQQNLETMYLSALDVSIERFRLDSQFFGGTGTSLRRNPARLSTLNPTGITEATLGSSFLSMDKLYSTGGTLLVDFANSITWQIAGSDTWAAPSIFSFTFIQPLLRNGGRDVVLERLTLAERALLTNVRAFERFRRGFYVEVATGVGADTSPSRQGGAFGGAGLGGFDALGSVFANAGGGGFGGGGAGVQNANGYIGLLQDQLNISNERENIIRLQDIYLQFQDNYRELLLKMPENQTIIPSQQLQVAQAQQSVYEAQSRLLTLQSNYETTLDAFKRTLGLPPYLCVEIKDDLLRQFELISQDLRDRRTDMATYRAQVGQGNSDMLALTTTERDPETGEAYRVIEDSPEVQQSLQTIRALTEPIGDLLTVVQTQDIPTVRRDIEILRENVPKRRVQLDRLKSVAESERGMICSLLPLGDFNTTFLDGEGLEELPDTLAQELDELTARIDQHVVDLQDVLAATSLLAESLSDFPDGRSRFEQISELVILGSQDLIAAINEDILAIQLVQARVRTESVVLPEIELEPRDALEIARRNRRDWLIRKASLVDTWRRIELVADNLESVLDVTISGDVRNLNGNPFALHSSTGNLRAGLAWDAPITRVQERNNYRQILIQYQQARRSFYQYEDGVWQSLRGSLRQIRQSQLAFEIQRFAVQNAALQIIVNEDIRLINDTLGQSSGPDAARNAVQGLTALLNSQNQLIGIYATFESRRRVLDRDLGTMQIDAEGLWIDPGPLTLETVGGGFGAAVTEFMASEGMVGSAESIEVAPVEEIPTIYPAGEAPIVGEPVDPTR